jgi:hypothetical protein
MATVLELARYAGVSAENVLRVLHREPVSEDIATLVSEAISALGAPPSPQPAVEVLPGEATAELNSALPEHVGSVVHQALRVEVRPVAQNVAELGSLFEQMIRRLESIGNEVDSERGERIQDVALLTELITTGWRSVDRRLGRIEQMIARLETRTGERPPGRVIRLGEHPNRSQTE